MNLAITSQHLAQYRQLFTQYSGGGNAVSAQQVAALFNQSGVSPDRLQRIWTLADIDRDSRLDFDEFCVAMRLIYGLVQREVTDVPASLPQSLIPSTKAHLLYQQQPVQQPVQQPTSYAPIQPQYQPSVPPQQQRPVAAAPAALNVPFDWYISSSSRSSSDSVFDKFSRGLDVVYRDSVSDYLRNTIRAPWEDVMSAWNLVDIRRYSQLNREQFAHLMHILNERQRGVKIPTYLPNSIRQILEDSLIKVASGSPSAKQTAAVPAAAPAAVKRTPVQTSSVGRTSTPPTGLAMASATTAAAAAATSGVYGENSRSAALADSYYNKVAGSTTTSSASGTKSAAVAEAEELTLLQKELDELDVAIARSEEEKRKTDQKRAKLPTVEQVAAETAAANPVPELREMLEYLKDVEREQANELPHRSQLHQSAAAPLSAYQFRELQKDVEKLQDLTELLLSQKDDLTQYLRQMQTELDAVKAETTRVNSN